MELFRHGPAGSERPAVRHEGHDYDLTPLTADLDGDFFAAEGIERVAAALEAGELPEIDTAGRRIGSPIARPPGGGVHRDELRRPRGRVGRGPAALPDRVPQAPRLRDRARRRRDPAAELGEDRLGGRARGRHEAHARYLSDPSEALDYVAGYALSNDLSERAFQLEESGGQWSKGKCAETFNPLGPVLRPASEIDPTKLQLRSWVNGEVRQDSSTADMVFSVAEIIHHLSHYMLLMPGDVISTGTPEGVALSGRFPYLKVGDVVTMEIDGLGRQEQVIVAY